MAIGVGIAQLAERAAVDQQQARAPHEHARHLSQRFLLVCEDQHGLIRQPVAVAVDQAIHIAGAGCGQQVAGGVKGQRGDDVQPVAVDWD